MTGTAAQDSGRVARWLPTIAAVAFALIAPSVAHADRAEASLHAHALGGAAIVSDPATADAATTPIAGIAIRASYARSNLYQYDAQLTFASTGAASFQDGSFTLGGEPATGVPFALTTRLVRLDAGVTFRFGVRVIPTLRLAIGVDERLRGAPIISFAGSEQHADGRDGDTATDLVGVGAVGLDYRFGRHMIAGASVGGTVAAPLGSPGWKTIEASVHFAYYFYPLWFD